jgi:hypothetical protein
MSWIPRKIQLVIVSILIIAETVYSYAGKSIVVPFLLPYSFSLTVRIIIFPDSTGAPEKCNESRSDCLKCDVDGICKKCRKVLIVATGQCAETCPSGYEHSWSTNDHQMGRVCSLTGLHTHNYSNISFNIYYYNCGF